MNRKLVPIGIAVTALCLMGADKSGCSSSSTNATSSPAAPDTASAPGTTAAAPATTAAPAPKVLLLVTGSGTKTTQKFTAAADWDLNWTYDCTRTEGGQGNFQVYIYSGGGSLSDIAVNELGAKGSDVTHEHQGGTYYLEMNSECPWTVKVTG